MNKKRALFIIFLTILTDLIGFGMIIPLSPLIARDFGADGLEVGLLISIYSLAQFIFAPFWGRFSDIFGRKPILLCGLIGMSLAHFWFAYSDTLFQLFISRAIAGFFGGNIAIGTAYISDITQSQNRTKNLGLIGVAFGLGFTIGPILGGLFLFLGQNLGSAPPFGVSFASLAAGFLSLLNFVMTLIFLKESHPNKISDEKSFLKKYTLSFSRPSLKFIRESLRQPVLGKFFFLSFLLWFVLAQIEPTLILLVRDDFFWTQKSAYWGFAYIGFLMVFTQGFLVRRYISRWGEQKMNLLGLIFFSMGLFLMGASLLSDQFLFHFLNFKITLGICILALSVTLFSIGYSLASTSISGSLSLLSSSKNQGQVFGVNQSLSALARILGPICGGWFYRDLSHMSPFLIAGGFSLGGFILAYKVRKSFPNSGQVKKIFSKKDSVQSVNDPSLYSLNQMQFSNLIQKRIGFCLIPMENFSNPQPENFSVKNKEGEHCAFLSHLFMKLNLHQSTLHNITLRNEIFKDSKASLDFLKTLPKDQALVFICEKGDLSKSSSLTIQEQGYFNAYYLENGWKNL